jgi:putative FmdB family regulatory protein
MPLYEYQCDVCGTRFERIQKFSDPPVDSCPSCHGAVRKLVSSPAIQFKGSGWYITDYAKKGASSKEDGKEGKPAADGGTAKKGDAASADAAGGSSSSSDSASSPSSPSSTSPPSGS